MRNINTKRMFLIILLLFLLVSSSTAAIAIVKDSDMFKKTLDRVNNFFSGGNALQNKQNRLSEIVAYVNDEPIYKAEVIAGKERGKIFYNEAVLKGEKGASIEYLEKRLSISDLERYKSIAQARVVTLAAEKAGFFATDEKVKKNQEEIIQERKNRAEQGDEIAIEIEKQYQALYGKLGVTEEEYYQTFDFLYQKYSLISEDFVRDFDSKYFERIKGTGEKSDIQGAWESYLEDLLKDANFYIVDKNVEKA